MFVWNSLMSFSCWLDGAVLLLFVSRLMLFTCSFDISNAVVCFSLGGVAVRLLLG